MSLGLVHWARSRSESADVVAILSEDIVVVDLDSGETFCLHFRLSVAAQL
jgi:hypothetical protein